MKHTAISVLLVLLIVTLLASAQNSTSSAWTSLFDGKSLGKWEETPFGGVDEIHVRKGAIEFDMPAADMVGITWKGSVPSMNYEVALEAMRVMGNDFFCCLTFPVGESCCSLVVGGWGGTLVGLSSIDELDASQNETTVFREFGNKLWYRIRVQVMPTRIKAWIDDDEVVNISTEGRKISVRYECENSRPLGISSWHTQAALRNIRIRSLSGAN